MEATSLWLYDLALEMPELEHSQDEERWIRLGFSREAKVLVVVYVEKIEGQRIRIISARPGTRSERKHFSKR